MFMRFFTELRQAKVPVTLKEYLMLMEGLDKQVIDRSVDDFYYLSRAALVKDEKNIDKFDQVFGHVFKGLERMGEDVTADIPAEWLKKLSEKFLTDEEKAQIEAMGGFDKLMEALAERIKRAEGAPREGRQGDRHRRHLAVRRQRLSPRRRPHRPGQGPPRQGDQGLGQARVQEPRRPGRARHPQHQGGAAPPAQMGPRRARPTSSTWTAPSRAPPRRAISTSNMRPERRNKISVLIFFDIGGSMDSHIKVCEELFSAARSEFKNMEFYYFHNCLYESVWKDNRRRHAEKLNTWDVLHKFPHDYKVIFVGDATMSPYEITYPGGSVEHWNEEAGAVWMDRVANIYEHMVWLNPTAERHWDYTPSIGVMKQLVGDRMFPLTLAGLEKAMKELAR